MAQLSVRYATALFELAMERGLLNEYLEQSVFLCKTLGDEECQRIITHPKVSAARKRAFFEGVFAGIVHKDLLGFLRLAVAKNREGYIVPALSAFIGMGNHHLRKVTAYVVSAVPLKADQMAAIVRMLSKKLNKQVELSVKVDPSIIGGLYIQADGYFIDRTIKNQLREIKTDLRNTTGSLM